jgi:hypothetical protein
MRHCDHDLTDRACGKYSGWGRGRAAQASFRLAENARQRARHLAHLA